MRNDNEDAGAIRQASETSKGVFAYRIITATCGLLGTSMIGLALTILIGMSRDITQVKIDAALASGRADLINQRISDVASRVDIHASRLEKLDTKIWTLETHRAP